MSSQESTLSRLKNEVPASKTSTKWMEPLVYLLPVAAIAIYVVILIEESMIKSPIPIDTQRSVYGWMVLFLSVWFFVSILFFLDRVPLLIKRARMNKKDWKNGESPSLSSQQKTFPFVVKFFIVSWTYYSVSNENFATSQLSAKRYPAISKSVYINLSVQKAF